MAQKRKRKKNNKKCFFGGVLLLLFVGTSVICYLVWNAYFDDKDGVTDDGWVAAGVMEKSVEKSGEKLGEKDGDSRDEAEAVKKKVVQYEGEDPNEAEELTGVVTYAGVNGDNLLVQVNIDQYLSEGSCGLQLLQDGVVVYEDTVEIVAMVSTATCDGFEVPVKSLGGGGYDIVINLVSGGKMGTIRGEAKL